MSNKTDRETRGAMASTSQLYKQGKLSRPKLAQTEGNKTDREATCLRCGNKVGNPVFTFCDDCWGSRPAAQPQRSKTMGVGRDLAAEQRDLNEPKHPCDQPRPSNLSSDTNGNPTDRENASGSVSDAGTKRAHPLSPTQAPSNEIEVRREELSAACYNERQHDGDIGMQSESDCYCVRCCAVRLLAIWVAAHPSNSGQEWTPETISKMWDEVAAKGNGGGLAVFFKSVADLDTNSPLIRRHQKKHTIVL